MTGTIGDDVLVGQGGNDFAGLAGEDTFVFACGEDDVALTGEHAVGFIGFGIGEHDFNTRIAQTALPGALSIPIDGHEMVTLDGVGAALAYQDFHFA